MKMDGPYFKKGDKICFLDEMSKFSKFLDFNTKLKTLSELSEILVVGTKTLKRFPKLFDHENDEYIQLITVNSGNNTTVEVPSSRFKLIGD